MSTPSALRVVAAGAVALALTGAGVAAAAPGAAPAVRVWIDDPLGGAVLLAGPVSVQAHGDSAEHGLTLLVDDNQVATQPQPAADGRLDTTMFSWTATEGMHALVVKSGDLRSQPTQVYVVADDNAPGGGTPPSHPTPHNPKQSAPRSPEHPHRSDPHPPGSDGGSEPSPPGQSDPGSPVVSAPVGHLPISPVSPTAPPTIVFHPPLITSVVIAPRALRIGDGCTPRVTAISVAVSGATAVSVEFHTNVWVQYRQSLAEVGGRWSTTVSGTDLSTDNEPTDGYHVVVVATRLRGRASVSAGNVSVDSTSCIH